MRSGHRVASSYSGALGARRWTRVGALAAAAASRSSASPGRCRTYDQRAVASPGESDPAGRETTAAAVPGDRDGRSSRPSRRAPRAVAGRRRPAGPEVAGRLGHGAGSPDGRPVSSDSASGAGPTAPAAAARRTSDPRSARRAAGPSRPGRPSPPRAPRPDPSRAAPRPASGPGRREQHRRIRSASASRSAHSAQPITCAWTCRGSTVGQHLGGKVGEQLVVGVSPAGDASRAFTSLWGRRRDRLCGRSRRWDGRVDGRHGSAVSALPIPAGRWRRPVPKQRGRAPRAREQRDLTVPSATPRIRAASATGMSSRSTSTTPAAAARAARPGRPGCRAGSSVAAWSSRPLRQLVPASGRRGGPAGAAPGPGTR